MNFTNAKYVSYNGNNQASIRAELDGKTVCIPIKTANRHYQAILEWVEDGNTIEDAD